MNKSFLQYLQISLVILDVIILNVSFLICWTLFSESISYHLQKFYIEYLFSLNTFWLIAAWASGLYITKTMISFESFSRRTTRVYLISLLSIFLYLYFFRRSELGRLFFASSVVALGIGLLINRLLYLFVLEHFKKGNHLIRVLIVGYNEVAKKLARYFEEEGLAVELLGFAEDAHKVKELTHYPILTTIDNSVEISKLLKVDEIYSTITPEQSKNIYNLINKAESECIRFKIIPDFSLFIQSPIHIDFLRDIPILSLRSEPLENTANRIKKRVFDIIVSLIGIILIMSILIPVIGLLIFLESPGPIFFVQSRTGKNNRNFKCIKFRSMKINGAADSQQATKDDDRITRIGRFIRKTSIDEFPQLFNVLMGDMSIVGPRPHMIYHTESYSKTVSQYMVRQFLKPGITGWAQVNGFRGETRTLDQMQQRINHDVWYLEHWSLWLDVRIIFLTLFRLFKGDDNAY